MMDLLRDSGRSLSDLVTYAWRTGRWWMPVAFILLAVAAVAIVAAKVVVPTVVYTLF